MPCLNEAETLASCIAKAFKEMTHLGIRGEVLVADNGSTDGSQQIGREAGARVVHVEERGYGGALRGGIEEARGKYVIMGDADDSYDFSKLELFVNKLREGYNLVLGNRFQGGIAPGAMPFLHQYLGNPVLTALGKVLFKSPAGDIYCGLRGFDRQMPKQLGLMARGMEFAIEMVIKATMMGMKIAEVPTTLSCDGRSGRPHLRTWRDGWRTLRFMLLYSPNWLFLYPGMVLMITGLLMGGRLLHGPLEIRGVGFDTSTLLFSATAVILGFQSILTSLFSKTFAISRRLLPKKSILVKAADYFSLEASLGIGISLVVLGLVGAGVSVQNWARQDFGPLILDRALRTVIPSVTFIILGTQTIMASFFLGVLSLETVPQEG
ncbi:MAG: dolichol-P-glucose synthetase [Deltaproteobacteria bacterium]|nr:MAG: dolichol-P-glucose synthetase [Deltaproteobacteria bacterium]